MNALELTQRQRELLENIAKAATQYRQAVAEASGRLERELKQIEQSRDQERQRIEEERRQTEFAFKQPAKDEKERKQREEFKRKTEETIAAGRFTVAPPRHITTVEGVKREINTLSSQKIRVDSTVDWIVTLVVLFIFLASSCYLLTSSCYFLTNLSSMDLSSLSCLAPIVSFGILAVLARRSNAKARVAVANRILSLRSLYDRWLELVDERASAQRAEAQRRYEQAVAQAKGQMLAAAEQSRLSIAEFSTLTEPVSTSWESEAWRRWEPGSLGPSAVRLGVFKMEV